MVAQKECRQACVDNVVKKYVKIKSKWNLQKQESWKIESSLFSLRYLIPSTMSIHRLMNINDYNAKRHELYEIELIK